MYTNLIEQRIIISKSSHIQKQTIGRNYDAASNFYFEFLFTSQNHFMFFHFITVAQLIILIHQGTANWMLIEKSFSDIIIGSNNWQFRNSCSEIFPALFQQSTCSENQQKYVKLDDNIRYLYKSFDYKCFQAQVIFDVFYDDADDINESQLIVSYDDNKILEADQQLYQRYYKQSDLIQNSARICHSTLSNFEFHTIVSTIANSNTNYFKIKFCFTPQNTDMKISIKNLLIYVNTCHPTCLTCNGPTETQCLSCYYGSVNGGKCMCYWDQQFSETFIGCRQECSRDYSIARFDKICVIDNRIKQKFTLFQNTNILNSNQRYFPLIFQKDEFYSKGNTDLIYDDCDGHDFVGMLQFNEGMIYQMNLENAVKFIRIRITFYLFNFQQASIIEILHNNQIQSRIIKQQSGFQVENSVKIFQNNQVCQGNFYTLLRIEMTFQLYNPNPTILIQGQIQSESESWGFRNITVDIGFCQENCSICLDFSTCSQCYTPYQLYKKRCVQTCPVHSSNCIDYEDIVPYSRYLAKGFYDLNMTLEEIGSFYEITTDPSFSLSTSQKFSFFNNKIVLGGLLVWNDGSYIKTWTILNPHYAASIYFNLTYGDDYTGQFFYKIADSSSSDWQGPFSNPGGGYNLIGRTGLESTRHFNVSLANFYSNNLYVEFKCDVENANITQGFCAISEYFIVIHYCPPFCSSCSRLTECSDTGYTGSYCESNQYLDFNTSTEIYSCKDCNQPGCNTCTSLEECTQCVSNQFYLTNGICLCNPFTFLSENTCIECNKYCENCYGNSQSHCLTCVKDYYRGIQRHQCLCLPGYYDDLINLPCLPICGDLLIVEGEDCDDGNNNPFDGCHNCKFSCNFACDICLNGKCYQCKSGYEVHNNDCRSVCLENTITLLQQCNEEKKNCINCQYECSTNCLDCCFGSCVQCNEKLGWYIQIDGTCNSICGDGIVANLAEMCDDGNANPFDGCHQCQFSCDQFCHTCHNSLCIFCQIGYKLIKNKCIPQCNDGLLVFPELCEDGNKTQFDGCFNCQFQCSNHCIDCQFGICYQCNEFNGWYLQQDGSCKSICGDNLLVFEVEECDDDYPESLCKQCQITCDINCLQCYKGTCIFCIQGYKWDFSLQQCVMACGDSVFFNQNNVCEDGNNQLEDGCYQCQFNCQQSCTLCTSNGCLQCNTEGWKLDDLSNKCETICGDGITVKYYEECDDLIDQNCFQCKYSCQDSCLICYKGDCLSCKKGWIVTLDKKCHSFIGDSFVVGDEQCDDHNSIMYDGCYLSQYQCQKSCIICQFGICIKCTDGNQNIAGKCLEILNDGYITGNEQCDDKNLIAQDGCFHGQFDCPRECEYCYQGQCIKCYTEANQLDLLNNQCISLCVDGYLSNYAYCDDPYYECSQYCDTCKSGVCTQCQIGYYLDKQKNTCYSICGDGILSHDEQCDNGDSFSDQQCVNCKLLCQAYCTTCVNGACFQCISLGWQLNVMNRNCQPICGDQLVLGNEQCDDGNNIDDDGCDNCYFQIQKECSLYEKGQCRACDVKGWELTINRCTPICGDQLILGTEECDDGNMIPYDGCYECKFSCEEQCTLCENGICKACIKPGWILNQYNICTTQCGDGIVIDAYEQCDDGNDIQYDGCYQCEFSCYEGCIECQQQQCKKCDYQYQLDIKSSKCLKKNNQDDNNNDQVIDMQVMQLTNLRCGENQMLIDHVCINQCGNGILINQYEECDDGNNYGGDGCSNLCLIEDSYQCMNQQGSLSLCTYILAPEFNLNILSDNTEQTQIVELTFTQQVKLKQAVSLEEIIVFTIIPSTRYNLITSSILNLTNTLGNPKYQIQIEFIEPTQYPILQVDIQKNIIFNQYELSLQNHNKTINLGTPFVLSEKTQQQVTSIAQLNDVMMYSMAGVSSLALLSGNAVIFFNLLELLQSLSYVRYMQCKFPPNLNYFLNTYTKISMQPIFDYLKVDQVLEKLNGGSKQNQVTKKTLEDHNIIFKQPYLFNAKSCYFSVFSSALTYLIYCQLSSLSIENILEKLFFKYQKSNKIMKFINIFQRKVQKMSLKEKKEYFSNGIFKMYFAILHQFMFSAILQFPNYKFDSLFSIFNSINAILGLIFIATTNLQLLQITTVKIKNKLKWKYFYNEAKNEFWAGQFRSFQIYRIFSYIFTIVKLRNYPEAQSILLSIQSLLFFIYMIKFKPLKSPFELYKLICREFLLMIISGTFLVYSFKLSQDNFIQIGWIHIGMFSTIMASNLFIDLFQQLLKVYDNYLQKKTKQKIKEEREYQFKHLQGFQINKNDFQQQI
ncbi:unnamed protein product [Paramecium sonneborni]|uniref:EGF-like domain-containing protein n=1 Tax=Paramecium sonneborni TaxID=65129 RepID=A0A8S1PP36_9CILI|nr:unnamed protein product [Paramecium sonneborni]